MGIAHGISEFNRGFVQGTKNNQRDSSPYLVHFTSFRAMEPLREYLASFASKTNNSAKKASDILKAADQESFGVFEKIISSRKIISNSPSEKGRIPECVCFTECTLPGLLSHCERYGRFGFVFGKSGLYNVGARPCTYIDPDMYKALSKAAKSDQDYSKDLERLLALSNKYSPSKSQSAHRQDYLHEREWRFLGDIDLSRLTPDFIVCPSEYSEQVRKLSGVLAKEVIPIDVLFKWGA